MAKKPTKVFYPAFVDQMRESALGITEKYIAFHGGDRTMSDPGPDLGGVAMVQDMVVQQGPMFVGEDGRPVSMAARDHMVGQLTLYTHRSIRWVNSGLPMYALDAETATNFALTGVGKLTSADLKFPYDTFLIILDPGTPMYIEDEGRIRPARYVFVHHIFDPLYDSMALHLEVVGGGATGGAYSTLPYKVKGKTVSAKNWLKQISEFGAKSMTVEDAAALASALRMVIAFSIYMTTPAGKPKRARSKRKTKTEKKARDLKLPLPTDWIVTPITLDTEVKEAVRKAGPRATNLTTLIARHIVRGHMRPSQGIFIKPYKRGSAKKAVSKTGVPKGAKPSTENPRRRKRRNPRRRSGRSVISKYLRGL